MLQSPLSLASRDNYGSSPLTTRLKARLRGLLERPRLDLEGGSLQLVPISRGVCGRGRVSRDVLSVVYVMYGISESFLKFLNSSNLRP